VRFHGECLAAKYVSNSGTSWNRSGWYFNPYFRMFTYIPMNGMFNSPYGYLTSPVGCVSFSNRREIIRAATPATSVAPGRPR
jgi:hypothetical protein